MIFSRKLAAEALGTGWLVATVVGSGIMAARLSPDIGIELLGNTLPTGAMLFVLVSLFGPISGAHFNPVVSLLSCSDGGLTRNDAMAYSGAQILGGVLGTLAAHAMFGVPIWELSTHVRSGGGQWFAEGVATFGLILTIGLGVRFKPAQVPMLVALYITAAYWFTASTSFANPAVTIARMLTDTFSGIRPMDAPGFIIAQLLGGLAGHRAVRWLTFQQETQA